MTDSKQPENIQSTNPPLADPKEQKRWKRLSKRAEKWYGEWCENAGLRPMPHQLSGLKWAAAVEAGIGASSSLTNKGGLIADEMGLGKTMVSLALMLFHPKSHQLIVVPRVLIAQWRDIIIQRLGHTPLVAHGPNVRKLTEEQLSSAPIVITTYGMIAERKKPTAFTLLLAKQKWGRVVFDEAHHIRNRKKMFKGAAAIETEKIWFLSGTPIQNSKRDLYAFWNLLGFTKGQIGVSGFHHKLVTNLILRRTKASVGLDLQTPDDKIVNCGWQDEGEQDISDQFHATLNCLERRRTTYIRTGIQVFSSELLSAMVRCRQTCVAATLFLDKLKAWEQERERAGQEDELAEYSPPPPPLPELTSGSKVDEVCEHLITALNDESKLTKEDKRSKLVFCHYLGAMNIIEARVLAAGFTCGKINGKTKASEKSKLITERFDVLILQIRTGCEGLNLQEYSDVYFVTPHWNPAVEEQAIGRCHRIGQTKRVRVFRFVMNGTGDDGVSLDEFCVGVQERKLKDAQMIPVRDF